MLYLPPLLLQSESIWIRSDIETLIKYVGFYTFVKLPEVSVHIFHEWRDVPAGCHQSPCPGVIEERLVMDRLH